MSGVFGLWPQEPTSLLSWITKTEALAGGLPADIEELKHRLAEFVSYQDAEFLSPLDAGEVCFINSI